MFDSAGRPVGLIWKKWSMKDNQVAPDSSAAVPTLASSPAMAVVPPSISKIGTWKPSSMKQSPCDGVQARTTGFSTSSHHWRKLVGLVDCGVRGLALSRPLSFATAMSSIPCAIALDIPSPIRLPLYASPEICWKRTVQPPGQSATPRQRLRSTLGVVASYSNHIPWLSVSQIAPLQWVPQPLPQPRGHPRRLPALYGFTPCRDSV